MKPENWKDESKRRRKKKLSVPPFKHKHLARKLSLNNNLLPCLLETLGSPPTMTSPQCCTRLSKTELLQADAAAKVAVLEVEQVVGWHSKPVWKGAEDILTRERNINWPSNHGGDVLGSKCQKPMACRNDIFDQMKALSLEKLKEDGGSEQAKTEVSKQCDMVTNACCFLMVSFLF
jgi:hypothetical protein